MSSYLARFLVSLYNVQYSSGMVWRVKFSLNFQIKTWFCKSHIVFWCNFVTCSLYTGCFSIVFPHVRLQVHMYCTHRILDFCVVQGMFPKHKSCNAKERTLQKRWRQSSQACITVLLYYLQPDVKAFSIYHLLYRERIIFAVLCIYIGTEFLNKSKRGLTYLEKNKFICEILIT